MRNFKSKSKYILLGVVISISLFVLNCNCSEYITIEPGQVGIIGYGSLTSKESMEKTLNRPYDGVFEVAQLNHWERNWYASMPNDGSNGYSRFYTIIDSLKIYPDSILYLNISPDEDAFLNCCLFVIDSSELKLFDEREWIYDKVDITDDISIDIRGGKVVAYQIKPEFFDSSFANKTIKDCAVRYTYTQTLENAFKDLGEEYEKVFYETTIPFPKRLLIQDQKDSLPQ